MLALCSLNISIQCPSIVGDLQMDAEQKVSSASMKRYLKKVDAEGGIESKIKDNEVVLRYLYYCIRLSKPRKIVSTINRVLESDQNHPVLTKFLDGAGDEIPIEVIRKISKIEHSNMIFHSRIGGMLLSADISGQFRRYKPNSEQKERLYQFLSDTEALNSLWSVKIFDELFLRLQKMYREGKWDEIISLFEKDFDVNDNNFQCYKFLILSLKRRKKDSVVKEKLELISKNISKKENLEDLVDILYTNNMHKEVISTCTSMSKVISFRTTLIYSRSLRKSGLNYEADSILEEGKSRLHDMINQESADISSITKSIMDIGYSGDIQASERLLFELASRKGVSSEISEGRLLNQFVDLVKDTLDRQKRIRLADALEISNNLLKNEGSEVAFRLLDPYIEHGIGNSADLYDLYARAAVKSGNLDSIENLLQENARNLNLTTLERLLVTLDSLGQYNIHSDLIRKTNTRNLDSVKVIRSFFKVRTQYSGGLEPTEYLKKITSLRGGCKQLSFFVDSFCRQELPPNEAIALIISSQSSSVEKLSCILRIHETNNHDNGIVETTNKIERLSDKELNDVRASQLIDRAVTQSFNKGRFDRSILLVERYAILFPISKQMASVKIRSLIAQGDVDEARKFLDKNTKIFNEIQQLRFLLQLGEKGLVKSRIGKMNLNSMPFSKSKNIASILFSLNLFEDYCEIYRGPISDGDFDLIELTRYFHSLCKLGEDGRMIEEYAHLKNNFSLIPKTRAILAIVGYDFSLSKNFVDEIEIALAMDTKKIDLSILICNSFIALERIDVAFHFFSASIRYLQHSSKGLEIGNKLERALKLLEISPYEINKNQLIERPQYTDVQVIRSILKKMKDKKVSSKAKKRRRLGSRIAVNSHTLDIGGAERQVSLLLRLLSSGDIKSSSFSLVTNSVPSGEVRDTYYPLIDGLGIEIFEYSKPRGYYGNSEIEKRIEELLLLMAPLKSKRVMSMIPIFRDGDFEIVHTWQDWCNIYGGVAAVIAGSGKIILSGRTLPPNLKGRLQARSGRSYADSYKQLLTSDSVVMTHNSDSGKKAYSEWLEIPENEFSVIHNGLETEIYSERDEKRIENLRKKIGISEGSKIIGTVGRMTSDKRPWLFLGMAERVLSPEGEIAHSQELQKWIRDNQINDGESEELDCELDLRDLKDEVNFVMVGDGPQLDKARAIVRDSKILNGRVHLVGYSSEVNDYLGMFDCFVLTSRVEGLPNVIIEAQFCGVPVLTTNAGGARECIIEGETGILSESASVESLASNLAKMLGDKQFLHTAREKSKQFAEEAFGQKSWSEKMNRLYDGVKL